VWGVWVLFISNEAWTVCFNNIKSFDLVIQSLHVCMHFVASFATHPVFSLTVDQYLDLSPGFTIAISRRHLPSDMFLAMWDLSLAEFGLPVRSAASRETRGVQPCLVSTQG
jgi:hypothetical protein